MVKKTLWEKFTELKYIHPLYMKTQTKSLRALFLSGDNPPSLWCLENMIRLAKKLGYQQGAVAKVVQLLWDERHEISQYEENGYNLRD